MESLVPQLLLALYSPLSAPPKPEEALEELEKLCDDIRSEMERISVLAGVPVRVLAPHMTLPGKESERLDEHFRILFAERCFDLIGQFRAHLAALIGQYREVLGKATLTISSSSEEFALAAGTHEWSSAVHVLQNPLWQEITDVVQAMKEVFAISFPNGVLSNALTSVLTMKDLLLLAGGGRP